VTVLTSEDHREDSGNTRSEESESQRFKGAVKNAFFQDGKLMRIPAKRSKRIVVLEMLLAYFKDKDAYHEREVNDILRQYHDDVATIRREFIMNSYMTRKDGYYKLTEKGRGAVA
jgi:hypothetical protein